MKKITILALHLGYGGIEKAVATLSNILSKKYDVEIISVYKLLDKPAFYIDDKVKIKYLLPVLNPNLEQLKQAIKDFNLKDIARQSMLAFKILWNRKYKMINEIKNLDSDIIISTRILFTKWLSKYGLDNIIKIAQEHRHHNHDKYYIRQVIKACTNIDFLMPVSKELTDFYGRLLNKKKTKCVYIPHALEYIPAVNSDLDKKSIISVGRLSKEKGFTTLIDVFNLVNKKYPDWKLNIIGDGAEKEAILKQIKHYNLEDNVIMHGYGDRLLIEKELLNSSIYVMSSFEESFGLVLIEAQSFGIPCVAFDSAQGATEIIRNNENGCLIKGRNIEEMANKIGLLIDDINARKKFGYAAKKNALKYSIINVAELWFDFIDNLT